jgi:hypothetical protein
MFEPMFDRFERLSKRGGPRVCSGLHASLEGGSGRAGEVIAGGRGDHPDVPSRVPPPVSSVLGGTMSGDSSVHSVPALVSSQRMRKLS